MEGQPFAVDIHVQLTVIFEHVYVVGSRAAHRALKLASATKNRLVPQNDERDRPSCAEVA